MKNKAMLMAMSMAMMSNFAWDKPVKMKYDLEDDRKKKIKHSEDFKAEKLKRAGKKIFNIEGVEIIARSEKQAKQIYLKKKN